MSRPFSYNDENFTVIGNILFLHIMMSSDIDYDDFIVEIPPEIYHRLIVRSIIGILSRPFDIQLNDSATWDFYFSEDNGKYYLKTFKNITGTYVITAYTPLKDI